MRKVMTFFSAAILLCSIGLVFHVNAQNASTPEARARSFYAWYLHELNAERNPIANSNGLRKYVTARMAGAIGRALKRENGIDADIFIDGQDFDPLWEKNISSSKATIKGANATVTITLKGGPGFDTKRLRVVLLKEQSIWKINSVNGITSP